MITFAIIHTYAYYTKQNSIKKYKKIYSYIIPKLVQTFVTFNQLTYFLTLFVNTKHTLNIQQDFNTYIRRLNALKNILINQSGTNGGWFFFCFYI